MPINNPQSAHLSPVTPTTSAVTPSLPCLPLQLCMHRRNHLCASWAVAGPARALGFVFLPFSRGQDSKSLIGLGEKERKEEDNSYLF